jgi:hypothetical protein
MQSNVAIKPFAAAYVVAGLIVAGLMPVAAPASAPSAATRAMLVAGVTLLFDGRYPRPVFDLAVGIDRWLHRVVAYACLMTDAYPPFRLDGGGEDTGARGAAPGAISPKPAAGLS